MTLLTQRAILFFFVMAYVVFIKIFIGFGPILELFAAAGWVTLTLVCTGLVVSQLIRTQRLKDSLRSFENPSNLDFFALYRLTQTHNILNTMLPFRSGEVSMPLLLRAEHGVPIATGAGILLWFRLLDVMSLVVLALLAYVVQYTEFSVSFVLVLVLLVAAGLRGILVRLRASVPLATNKGLHSRMAQVLRGVPTQTEIYSLLWAWSMTNWFVKLLSLGALVAHLANSGIFASLIAALGGELSSILPIHAPGGVGTYAGGVAVLGSVAGIDHQVLLKLGVLLHVLVIFSGLVSLILSVLLFSLRGKKI